MTKANSVRDLLAGAEQRLQAMSTARLDAEILLASAMQTGRASLYAHPERQLTDAVIKDFHRLISKRLKQYPVAYLTGSKEFWSLELKVDEHTLIPRPETECLVETALQYIPASQRKEILELGTGSGAIAIAIAAERPACQVLAVDISKEALGLAAANAGRHKIRNVEFMQSDWFSALTGRQFDLIISNPPYVESNDKGFSQGEIMHEPRLALDGGQNGLQAIAHLIPGATHFLKAGGRLILEHGHQQAEDIHQLFVASRYRDIDSRQDYAGLDRLSFGQWS